MKRIPIVHETRNFIALVSEHHNPILPSVSRIRCTLIYPIFLTRISVLYSNLRLPFSRNLCPHIPTKYMLIQSVVIQLKFAAFLYKSNSQKTARQRSNSFTSQCTLQTELFTNYILHTFPIPSTCYQLSWFDYPNNMWLEVQIMQVFTTGFYPASSYFLSLSYVYRFCPTTVLKHPKSTICGSHWSKDYKLIRTPSNK